MKFKSFKIVKICVINKIKLLTFLCLNFILHILFQFAQHFYEVKGKDPDPNPDLCL
jgi:hypothetical protein